MKVFTVNEMEKITEYMGETFFKYYPLYKYCLFEKVKQVEINYEAFVDFPSEYPPLEEALFMGQP